MEIPEHCGDGSFEYKAFVPSIKSQLTPWPVGVAALIVNSLILYPTYQWRWFSIFSALWSLIGGITSMLRVFLAKKGQMVIAHSMPFSLPLAIGAGIIRLTVEDGKKDFKERWKTLFAVVIRQFPWHKPLKTDDIYDIEKISNSNKTDDIEETLNSNETDNIEETSNSNEYRKIIEKSNSLNVYQRIEERLRLIALVIDLIAMVAGAVRVWEWHHLWDLPYSPYDSTLDTICFC
ncbi:3023_t:CDS:1 [Diversispora eburnea]|uniref:3023_t:CDS:1 n=1 Tax=Diversispora eburnea TaxID=1213867 RepID=A0A9N8V1G7_9GLOM|nr:3023_t:CDS:1 [Diversispora eburnea]